MPRRPIVSALRLAVPAVALSLLCVQAAPKAAAKPAARAQADTATIVHVLNRLGYGPAPGDVERVRAMGVDAYIEAQLHPERFDESALRARLDGLETLALDSHTIAQRYYAPAVQARRAAQRRAGSDAAPASAPDAGAGTATTMEMDERRARFAQLSPEERERLRSLRQEEQKVMAELGTQKLLRAVYSERQLEEVLVDFWFNHFNVFAGKGPVRVFLTEYERDAIRPHVLGRFRDLLGAVAKSPAMLFYLDNWQSADPAFAARVEQRLQRGQGQARRPRAGRPQMDAARLEQVRQRMPRGLNENYARELLELHTLGVDGGYTQQDVVEVAKAFTGWTIRQPREGGGFWFDERRHVKGGKTVLGTRIEAGGAGDGEAVLDLVSLHPSTARFIATKLARRFVADEPPAALVARAADTFLATGGDLRAVTRTIVTSPELRAAEARRAKVKTPFEFLASTLRASGADVTSGVALLRTLRELGMPLYFAQPPTGYADRAEAWVNTGALVARMNVAVDLMRNQVRGVRIDLQPLAGPGDLEAARGRLLETWLPGSASEATRTTLARADSVPQLAALIVGSPEFQRR